MEVPLEDGNRYTLCFADGQIIIAQEFNDDISHGKSSKNIALLNSVLWNQSISKEIKRSIHNAIIIYRNEVWPVHKKIKEDV